MKTKAMLIVLILLLPGVFCLANEEVPKAISPGSAQGVAAVESRCPTFSWSGVAWAQKYRVVVFATKSMDAKESAEMEPAAQPVLSEHIAGGALSWTPSVSQGLHEGVDYSWCVGAMDNQGTWTWSEIKRFRVDGSVRQALSDNDPAGLKQEKDGATVDTAADAIVEKDAGKKDMTVDPAQPMGTEGTFSTFYGTGAGASNSADSNANSFFGSGAGYANTSGLANVFMGYRAGYSNTTGNCNTFVGKSTGNSNTSGYNNTFMGYNAGTFNTSGYRNTFIGDSAGNSNTAGNFNIFIGYRAGSDNIDGSDNVFLGNGAGKSNTSGLCNVFVGSGSGSANSSGYYNTFLGVNSGMSATIGKSNVYIGVNAGRNNINGSGNTVIGDHAGFYNKSENNTFIGYQAGGSNSTGSNNVFIGSGAGYYEMDSNKLIIEGGMDYTSPLIYGEFDNNLVRINGTLETTMTGSNNVLAVTRTDGASFKLSAMGASGQLGTVSSHPVNFMTNNVKRLTLAVNGNVGIGVTVPTYPLHMASGAHCTVGGTWTNASSLALKQDITPLDAGAAEAVLRDLKPVTYAYKADASEKCVGFIAEEVPDLVAQNDRKGLSPMDIVAVLTKVLQEQQKTVQEQQKIAHAQQEEISFLKARLSALERQVAEKK